MTDRASMHPAIHPTSLQNILVVELGVRIAAGVCGTVLAQLGAETVLVEGLPGEKFDAGKAPHRTQFAPGKRSLKVDPESTADVGLLRELLRRADVVITSSDAGGEFGNGLGDDWMTGRIVCDITAFGRDDAGAYGTDWNLQALCGIAATTGTPDGVPTPAPLPVVEYMTGVYAASAVLAALRVRRISGAVQGIDMALYDSAFASLATFLPKPLIGDATPVGRGGNQHALISPWNVYQAEDGWILICAGSDAQWVRLCDLMGRPELGADERYAGMAGRVQRRAEVDAIVNEWTGRNSVEECERLLNEAALAVGAIVTIDPYPRERNLEYREMIRELSDPENGAPIFIPGSPVKMSETPGIVPDRLPAPDADRGRIEALVKEPLPDAPATGDAAPPLAGLRIVEIGHYTTVPLCTRHMGALGAEVIKIEPPGGEATRGWLPAQRGQGYFFTFMNSDKRSVVLDLRTDEGGEALRELLASADVLIENLKPGALARRGFGYDDIRKINSRLVYCAVSGFGHRSLYAGRPAYDSVIQAMSGIMDVVRAEGVPMKTGISIADLLGAEVALAGVLAALEYRDRTGRGQFVDISMQDVAAWLTQTAWNGAELRDVAVVACEDGYVSVEAASSALSKIPEIAVAGDGFVSDLNRDSLLDLLAKNDLRASPVLGAVDAVGAEPTKARGLWFEAQGDGETWPLLQSPLRLSLTPPMVRVPMPALGRDNESVLPRRS